MDRNRFLFLTALISMVLSNTQPAEAAPPISPGEFQRLHDLIRPHAGEARWTEIPWQASLWEARKQAAAAGKPILLWEMDGNPLGCT